MSYTTHRHFSSDETATWSSVLSMHEKTRENQVIDIFHEGLNILGISSETIPQLAEVNQTLKQVSGFEGVYVAGFEDGDSFYSLLSKRQFPIGNFLRDKSDLSYTPEPDMIHDLYGHIPFLANVEYADFCQKFGELAISYLDNEEVFHQFERFFWFTIEFGLIDTDAGTRAFGAGIASSFGECDYALSTMPEVIDFDIPKIINQKYRIDEMQKKLFILKNKTQLYNCLDELEITIKKRNLD